MKILLYPTTMSYVLVIKATELAVDFSVRCHIEVFHAVVCSPLTERRKDFVT